MTTPLQLHFHPPTTPLSINKAKSLHWGKWRRLTGPWRSMGWVLSRGREARLWRELMGGPVPITIQMDLPFRSAIRRDPHNYVGTTVKAFVDGLVDGGLIPDDAPEWATVLEPTISIQRDKGKPLMASVTITPRS